MGAAAVFWRAALTQGLFNGLVFAALEYSFREQPRRALVAGLVMAVVLGGLNGWWAVRDRRTLSRQLGGLFDRRSDEEIRRGLARPETADPGLQADLRRMLRRQVGDGGSPLPAQLIGVALIIGSVLAGFLVSPAWFLVAAATVLVTAHNLHRIGRLRVALRRLEALPRAEVG